MTLGSYPLGALLVLRERAVEGERRRLATALAEERAAASVRAGADAALLAARARLAERLNPLPGGEAYARGLQADARHGERLRTIAASAAGALDAAEEELRRVSAATARLRVELAEVDRRREAVARHRAAWERARAEALTRAEEAALDEASAARQAPHRGR